MKTTIKILLFFLLGIVPSIATSQIYKCSIEGKITYQSDPCPKIKNSSKQLSGFGFDGWKFGMSLRTVKQKARVRQLAMSPGQSIFLSRYNEKVLNSQPNKRSYTYKTKLLDKQTSVTLMFTKTTQELYRIKVTFIVVRLKPEEKKYFYESLYTSLSKKYGEPKQIKKESSGSLLADFLIQDTSLPQSQIIWKPNRTDIVSLEYNKRYHTKSSFKLLYEYLPLAIQNKKETTYELRQRTNKALLIDASKL